MKFVELKKSLSNNIKNAYLLHGDDSFLLNYSYGLIKEALNISFEEVNLDIFNDDVVNFTNVVNALNTLPMMSDYKLIYVNVEIKNGALQNLDDLVKYFSNVNKTSVLVINCGDKLTDFNKIINFVETVDCSKLNEKIVAGFVLKQLKEYNKSIDSDAMQTLIYYCNNDLSKINSEIIKLISFVGNKENIKLADVYEIVNKNIEFKIFEITEALGNKNAEKVYSLINELKNSKDGIKGVMPLIFNYFRRLFHISLNKNKTFLEIAKFLNIKEYAVKVSVPQANKFTKKQLKQICDLCAELEYKIKSGDTNNDNAIELLILFILNL